MKYVLNYKEDIDFYPKVGMSNSSHFSTNGESEMFQIYRSTFDAGIGSFYRFGDTAQVDFTVGWFKDLATTCIMHKADEFWGKTYYSPSGIKLGLNLRLLSLIKHNVELGGFYAQTFKDVYKEYGVNGSVVFAF